MSIVIGGSWTLCFLFMLLFDDNFWFSYKCDNNRNEINGILFETEIQYLRLGVELDSNWMFLIKAHFLELQIVSLFWMNFYLVDILVKLIYWVFEQSTIYHSTGSGLKLRFWSYTP